ncbi:MAG TPA: BlaI/MecI/CopY family transcriptional regulator [Gemmatimonadaceae bacterium]|nr:BlaI/MecI/CopY family transcriptional regulator [Gemmatimonadaceae bacterium]
MPPTFTERELDIMAVLWERGPSTVAEVRARLNDDLAHNTVLTVLTVLESKRYVDHTEEGKSHRFRARVKQEVAGATAASRVVEKLFGGSTERLLTHLVTERSVTAAELRRLRRLLDEKLREVDK